MPDMLKVIVSPAREALGVGNIETVHVPVPPSLMIELHDKENIVGNLTGVIGTVAPSQQWLSAGIHTNGGGL